jgi:hypothetical protein
MTVSKKIPDLWSFIIIHAISRRIQWVPGALSLGLKRPGREADHSPPSSAEVKNAWSCISTPPIRLHGVVLSQAQGKLYLSTLLHLYSIYLFIYLYIEYLRTVFVIVEENSII